MVRRGRSRWFWVAYLTLAAVALGNAGCLLAAAAGAAGGVAGYAYYKGKVSRPYVANVEDVRLATRKALAELQMPITKDEGNPKSGEIEAHAGNDKVAITLDVQDSPAAGEAPVTQVSIRVGTLGNEGLSERILDQISFHLVPPAQVPVPAPLGSPPPPLAPIAQPAPPPTAQTGPPPLAK